VVPVHVADCKTSLVKQKKSKKEKHTLDLRLETCGVVLRYTKSESELRVMGKNPENTAHVLRRNCWVNYETQFLLAVTDVTGHRLPGLTLAHHHHRHGNYIPISHPATSPSYDLDFASVLTSDLDFASVRHWTWTLRLSSHSLTRLRIINLFFLGSRLGSCAVTVTHRQHY